MVQSAAKHGEQIYKFDGFWKTTCLGLCGFNAQCDMLAYPWQLSSLPQYCHPGMPEWRTPRLTVGGSAPTYKKHQETWDHNDIIGHQSTPIQNILWTALSRCKSSNWATINFQRGFFSWRNVLSTSFNPLSARYGFKATRTRRAFQTGKLICSSSASLFNPKAIRCCSTWQRLAAPCRFSRLAHMAPSRGFSGFQLNVEGWL